MNPLAENQHPPRRQPYRLKPGTLNPWALHAQEDAPSVEEMAEPKG
jgi:hypothetical protein